MIIKQFKGFNCHFKRDVIIKSEAGIIRPNAELNFPIVPCKISVKYIPKKLLMKSSEIACQSAKL
ncbi:MAG: hypothetical protein M3Z87_12505, partial [Lactobacillus sp.]|nr:hypothetical protein [Lactobacillus sp.]